ncbi:MAG TPA: endonuclease MutS2 [Anaerolineae bacterium]|nr:endonuclease MutS2 [Anaerolineae bacterium]HOQ98001.1 endonuclease MutS2 [Anaerolineae bacterium]HPL26682.1 endonuclease MutS2 [Anaerolineae bacterium]
MDTKYLETLEYPKILQHLARLTSFSAGRELALALEPATEAGEVRQRQQETSEARALHDIKPDAGVGGARDVRPLVRRAFVGATLLPGDLLEVRETLIAGRTLKRTVTRLGVQFPLLASRAQWIEECTDLVNEIGRCINDRSEVVDAASPALARIRQELAGARDRLMDRLQRLVSADLAPYLQEALITQRSGRYVIPIKAEAKGRVQGIVHDQSASGATLFVEPLATVELNNRWRELELEEQHEVERILAALSAQVAENGALVQRTVEVLAELDLAFAKARYSYELRAVQPRLWEEGKPAGEPTPRAPLTLLRARHPLLNPETVVPIDVWLGGDFRVLVVTGPNTGGKTVALKTMGLLALMHQAGLHLPVDADSILPVFHGVYADIGDEQSIEQSLSTFSSHMTTIIDILHRAGPGSLVLLDELGAGTDPVEGSALAQAVIRTLLARDLLAAATTHYSELKLFAYATPGVSNASVEFDVETLSPTYELTIGLPGRSNALAIAKRLGLPQAIIDEATALVAPEDLQADALLAEIKAAREEAQEAVEGARAQRAEAETLRRSLAGELAAIDETRRQVIEEARAQVQRELETVRAELRTISAGLATETLTHDWLRQAAERVRQLEKEALPTPPAPIVAPAPGGAPEVGDTVFVPSLGQTGELVSLAGDEAEVQVGSFRLRTRAAGLELRHKAAIEAKTVPAVTRITQAAPSPGIELDLRGRRVEDALPELDKYIDNAYLAGLPYVRIIHGKGTGALRQVVREALAQHPLVTSHKAGAREEGGDGVTVAQLASLT